MEPIFNGAAIEIGLDPSTLEAALANANGMTATLARRLQHGVLPRGDVDRVYAYLKGSEAAEAAPPAALPAPVRRIGLSTWLDKPRPKAGDLIVVNIQPDTDCYLTLINVDHAGKATVVFPNDFEPENLISAGKPMRIPGADAPYQLRRKDEGREMLIAQCSSSPAPPTGCRARIWPPEVLPCSAIGRTSCRTRSLRTQTCAKILAKRSARAFARGQAARRQREPVSAGAPKHGCRARP